METQCLIFAQTATVSMRQLSQARNSSQVKGMRARIVLAAHEHPEWSNQQIAAHVGCSDRAVRKWRRRWMESKRLDDLLRPGAPRRFSPAVRTQATTLACSLPQEKGVPLSRWSLGEIVKSLLAAQRVSAISRSTVWRWLRADKLKPWRFHHRQPILESVMHFWP
jgi:transposase